MDGECYTTAQLKTWNTLNYEEEMGQILGLLQTPGQQLTSILENSGGRSLTSLLHSANRQTVTLLEQYLSDQDKDS